MDELLFDFAFGFAIFFETLVKGIVGGGVFVRQDGVFREKPMGARILADPFAALGRTGSGGGLRIGAVGDDLQRCSLTGHF